MNDKMTQTEETEIKNYLENIKSMRFLADKLNEKYFDERVSKYVINAMIDARNVIESLTEFISNNLDLFFDIKKLKPFEPFNPGKFKEYLRHTLSFWVDGLVIDLRIQSLAMADNTRYKSERVIAHFKEYLKEKYEKFKQLADEREKMLHKNLQCPEYQKVSI